MFRYFTEDVENGLSSLKIAQSSRLISSHYKMSFDRKDEAVTLIISFLAFISLYDLIRCASDIVEEVLIEQTSIVIEADQLNQTLKLILR